MSFSEVGVIQSISTLPKHISFATIFLETPRRTEQQFLSFNSQGDFRIFLDPASLLGSGMMEALKKLQSLEEVRVFGGTRVEKELLTHFFYANLDEFPALNSVDIQFFASTNSEQLISERKNALDFLLYFALRARKYEDSNKTFVIKI